jgi:hypothetical protein
MLLNRLHAFCQGGTMKALHLAVSVLTALVVFSLILSCDNTTAPQPEFLASFHIGAPDTVTAGNLFTITVTAVGTQGTSPYSSFEGSVVLTASGGSISPDTLILRGGTGSGQVVLSGSSDAQTIKATYYDIQGSIVVNAKFMSLLEGNPNDSANEAIPGFEFFANKDDYSDNHFSLSGMYVSHNTIMLAFELGTTVGQANIILSNINARIVGGITGDESAAPGTLFLKLQTSTHTELDAILGTLRANANVLAAVLDVLMGGNAIPKPNDGDPPTWTWESTPGGANWGLERIGVPQMWNFNEAVEKKMAVGQWPPSTVLIIDEGFANNHEDVYTFNAFPLSVDPHGTHVAGIIGAEFNNGKGIDGVCPYTFMLGKSVAVEGGVDPYQDRVSAGQAIISGLYYGMTAYVDVINMSIGYNWANAGIDSDTDVAAQVIVWDQAQLLVNTLNLGYLSFRSPLFIVSAGNDSGRGFGDQDARYNSPMCYAAIEMGIQNIIVVEAVMNSPGAGNGNVTRYPGSSIGGHVSAPGFDVWGTTSELSLYRGGDGTSYAAAMVTGVAAYLYVIEPYLTFLDVKNVILSTALSAGGGAKPRVDAWASVIDLDRVRGGDSFLRMMCDIDDGTIDGNQRVTYDGKEYLEDDADMDEGIGDGNVDMSDFRRWRDWFLLTQSTIDIDLDGDQSHPKKDVNNNGTVEDPAQESIFPRGDFNGDGMIDETATHYVPGAVGGEVSDLEVLQTIFSDPDYTISELPDLLYSSDYHVDITTLLQTSTSIYVELLFQPGGGVAATHTFLPGESVFVFTMPPHAGGYKVEVFAGGEEYEHGDRAFSLKSGRDAIFRPLVYIPLEAKSTYLHTCQDPALAATAISLANYGIKPGDVICLDNEGYFAYSSDPNWFSYDQIAVFSASSTLNGGSLLHRVPDAIDAGENFTTWPTGGCDGQTTDIPEDFYLPGRGTIIKVPAGATHLFVCGHDSGYSDNWSPSGRFGVQISVVQLPDELID